MIQKAENVSNVVGYLNSLGACEEAADWVNGFHSLQAAWEACDKPNWMDWLIYKTTPLHTGDSLRRKLALMCHDLSLAILDESESDVSVAMTALGLVNDWASGRSVSVAEVRETISKAYAFRMAFDWRAGNLFFGAKAALHTVCVAFVYQNPQREVDYAMEAVYESCSVSNTTAAEIIRKHFPKALEWT